MSNQKSGPVHLAAHKIRGEEEALDVPPKEKSKIENLVKFFVFLSLLVAFKRPLFRKGFKVRSGGTFRP